MLLARGHDVHALSRNKSTPLHYASWNGHSESVTILLESHADTERHMHGGDTALHQAAWNGHTLVARLLLDSGASMSATKEDGVCEHLVVEIQLQFGPVTISSLSKLMHSAVARSRTLPCI